MSGETGKSGPKSVATIVLAIVTSVASSVAVTSLQTEPRVGTPEATGFFHGYFTGIVEPERAVGVYERGTSSTFRSFASRDTESVVAFYETMKKVEVLRVKPVPGAGGNNYQLRLRFVPKVGKSGATEDFDAVLSCSDIWASLPKKSCPIKDVKIEVLSASQES